MQTIRALDTTRKPRVALEQLPAGNLSNGTQAVTALDMGKLTLNGLLQVPTTLHKALLSVMHVEPSSLLTFEDELLLFRRLYDASLYEVD
jgi:hypothetical protein